MNDNTVIALSVTSVIYGTLSLIIIIRNKTLPMLKIRSLFLNIITSISFALTITSLVSSYSIRRQSCDLQWLSKLLVYLLLIFITCGLFFPIFLRGYRLLIIKKFSTLSYQLFKQSDILVDSNPELLKLKYRMSDKFISKVYVIFSSITVILTMIVYIIQANEAKRMCDW